MSKVFICSPYRAETPEGLEENIELAKRISRYAAEQGHTVLCPHLLYPQFLDDNDKGERELGIKAGLEMLKDADEVWVPSWKVSEGMKREIAEAEKLGIPVKYFAVRRKDGQVMTREMAEKLAKEAVIHDALGDIMCNIAALAEFIKGEEVPEELTHEEVLAKVAERTELPICLVKFVIESMFDLLRENGCTGWHFEALDEEEEAEEDD